MPKAKKSSARSSSKRRGKAPKSATPATAKRPTKRSVQAIANPLVMSKNVSVGTPQFVRDHSGAIRVRFRECVMTHFDPNGDYSSAFHIYRTLYINPGLKKTFPWLSTMAPNFDQWKQNSLTVEYIPGVSATTEGFVMIVPDYDVTDNQPKDSLEALNCMGAVSTPAWCSASTSLRRPAAMSVGPRRFVRFANTANDNRLSDTCKIHICATSIPNGMSGQIWLNYDIELLAPQTSPVSGSGNSKRNAKKSTLAKTVSVLTLPTQIEQDISVVDTAANGLESNGLLFERHSVAGSGLMLNPDLPTVFNATSKITGECGYYTNTNPQTVNQQVNLSGALRLYDEDNVVIGEVESDESLVSTVFPNVNPLQPTSFTPINGALSYFVDQTKYPRLHHVKEVLQTFIPGLQAGQSIAFRHFDRATNTSVIGLSDAIQFVAA